MSIQTMVAGYDRDMLANLTKNYYDNSDFYNFGYWERHTGAQKIACENLMEKLLSFIPEKTGNILDVACGLGATTRYLLKHYQPGDVAAINISESQLAQGRNNAPGCAFLLMDASNLQFPDASFDNIICVEAAFHFNTRERFFREAYRVLRPGGRLALSDILCPRRFVLTAKNYHIPAVNYLASPDSYRQRLLSAGFAEANVVDATASCWGGFYNHIKRWPRLEREAGNLNLQRYLQASLTTWLSRNFIKRSVRYYVLASARKAG